MKNLKLFTRFAALVTIWSFVIGTGGLLPKDAVARQVQGHTRTNVNRGGNMAQYQPKHKYQPTRPPISIETPILTATPISIEIPTSMSIVTLMFTVVTTVAAIMTITTVLVLAVQLPSESQVWQSDR